MAMLLRNMKRFVGAKKTWSVKTRAAVVVLGFFRTTLCCRNLNQVVAMGPKTAESREVKCISFGACQIQRVEAFCTTAVERHSPCAREVVLPCADFLDALLRHDIASRKEHLHGCSE